MIAVSLKQKKTVNVTKEQFSDLKISEVSTLVGNHKLVIEETDEELKLWMPEERLLNFKEHPRLKSFEKVMYRSSEVGYISVPLNHQVVDTLFKRFRRAFLK